MNDSEVGVPAASRSQLAEAAARLRRLYPEIDTQADDLTLVLRGPYCAARLNLIGKAALFTEYEVERARPFRAALWEELLA
jgi:hypothetical protein